MAAQALGRRGLLGLSALVLSLTGCGPTQDILMATPKPESRTPATMVHITDIRPGMCLDSDHLPSGDRIGYLEVMGCQLEHTAEVVAVVQDTGEAPVSLADGGRCWDGHQAYIGSTPAHSGYEVRALTAADSPYAEQPATLVCLAVSPAPLTGSLRSTGT